ncbi:unnamed protein product [Parajaminaea phylloscopi]
MAVYAAPPRVALNLDACPKGAASAIEHLAAPTSTATPVYPPTSYPGSTHGVDAYGPGRTTTWPTRLSATSGSTVCGKRSRSNSAVSMTSEASTVASSSASALSPSSSDGYSSMSSRVFSDSDSASEDADSPASSSSDSPPPLSASQKLRACPSPSAAKRKTLRCQREHTACTAPAAALESDVADLDGAVQAFALNSTREGDSDAPSAQSSQPAVPASTSGASMADGRGKVSVVDHLVDASVATIDAIWKSPLPVEEPAATCTASTMPLQLFIRETLRRSRTSCSTLQAALLYCLRAAPAVRSARMRFARAASGLGDNAAALVLIEQQQQRAGLYQHLLCGRRIFLAAVMIASKFLQDRNYSNKAWSKITGLPLKELAAVEREFLASIKWDINVRPDEWQSWTKKLAQAKPAKSYDAVTPRPAGAQDALAAPLPRCVSSIRAAECDRACDKGGQAASHGVTSSPASYHSSSSSSMGTPIASRSDTPTPVPTPTRVAKGVAASHDAAPARLSLSRSRSDDAPFGSFDSQASTAASPSRPHAYPMPRAFVRNAASFSASSLSGATRPEIQRGICFDGLVPVPP